MGYWLEGGVRRCHQYPPVIRTEPTGSKFVTWGEFIEARYLADYRRRRGALVPQTMGGLISGKLHGRVTSMAESVYKVIELVGTSEESWEKAAAAAVRQASGTLRDLRIAEVVELDLQIEDGQVKTYRAKVKVSFKLRPRP